MRIVKKIFIISFLTAFVVMLITQVLLKNSDINTKISKLYEYESQYVYSENKISSGYIIIKISNPSDKLFLLQNGEKIAVLNKKEVKVDISDNSVIEVDGRSVNNEFDLKITDFSENIEGFYEKDISVKSNIVILGRFFIK